MAAVGILTPDNGGSVLVDADPAPDSVAEGAVSGSPVGVTFAVDGTPPADLSYTLVGDTSHGGFQVDPKTGFVSVADPSRLDYETSGWWHAYRVVVAASGSGYAARQGVSIGVTDVNDHAPVFRSRTHAVTFENVSTTRPVYHAFATDGDGTPANNTVRYALAAGVGDNDLFAIDPRSGLVTFKASPDFAVLGSKLT